MKMFRFVPLWLLAAAMLSPPADLTAQGTTYISNLAGNPLGSDSITLDRWLAQSFRTGGNPQGYVLNSVQLSLAPASGTPMGFSVLLYSANALDDPGVSLATLSGPANPSAGGVMTYSAPDITLLPWNRYWVVLSAQSPPGSGAYYATLADFFDYTSSDNWSTHRYYDVSRDGVNWIYSGTSGYDLQFAIQATLIPEPSSLLLLLCGCLVLAQRHPSPMPRTM